MKTMDNKKARLGERAAWSLWMALSLVCAPSAQAAISVSAPHDLPILTRAALPFSLAVLENGSFAVAAVEQPDVSRLLVQFFGADGTPKSEPIVIVQVGEQGFFGRVGSLGDRYLVTWQLFVSRQTVAAFYDAEGRRIGEPFPWTNPEAFSYKNTYLFGPAPDSRILASTFRQVGVESGGDPVLQPLLQVFDKETHALGPSVALGLPRRRTYILDVAVNGGGRFVVLEDQCIGTFSELPRKCFISLQVFDKGGRPRTGLLTQDIPQSRAARGKTNALGSVAIDANGNFLLLWVNDVFGRTQHLLAQLYDREGRPLSGVIPVRDASSFGLTQPRALPGGEFLVPSIIFTGPYDITSLYVQELKTGSRRLLPPVLVSNNIDNEFFLLEINSSGHGVVAWIAPDAQGNRAGGFFKLLSAGGGPAAVTGAEQIDLARDPSLPF